MTAETFIELLERNFSEIFASIADIRGLIEDMDASLGRVECEVAQLQAQQAGLCRRLDAFEVRLERVEERLDELDGSAPVLVASHVSSSIWLG